VLIDHIDHIARVAGIDHVGLGSDFDGVPSLPEGMKDVSELPNITYELLRRGYSEKDVRKVLGENFLRVFAEAEKVARAGAAGGGRTISGDGSVRRIESSPK
jgi:membrane dipeptidase